MTGLPARTNGGLRVRTARSPWNVSQAVAPAVSDASVVPPPVTPRLLRFQAVRERTGLSRSTIWRMERRGEFPRHHRISSNVVAWVEGEVSDWIRSRVAGE
jgi:prophage regulatory protein